jgi:vancomycin resistance protein YoaR
MTISRKLIALASILAVLALAIWAAAQPSRWKLVAAYRTSTSGRSSAQAHNLRLAVRRLDGRVIPPGGEFSFNKAVGSWSADQGYVKAPVSYNGELILSWGGGVCQASTTLYNAALLAGLEITERHRHQFPARYAPPGQDAAVAQYNIDLRFANPYPWPVKIEARADGDQVVCRILGQGRTEKTVTIEREVRKVIAPTEVVRTGSGPGKGRWHVVNHGAPGLRVAVYRRVTEAGRSTRTLISEDTYPPLNRLIESR